MNGTHSPAHPPASASGLFPGIGGHETPEAMWRAALPPLPIIVELGFRGIHVPPGVMVHKTTCPECSPWRAKKREPCLTVKITGDTTAEVCCYHCNTGWQEVRG